MTNGKKFSVLRYLLRSRIEDPPISSETRSTTTEKSSCYLLCGNIMEIVKSNPHIPMVLWANFNRFSAADMHKNFSKKHAVGCFFFKILNSMTPCGRKSYSFNKYQTVHFFSTYLYFLSEQFAKLYIYSYPLLT